MNRLGLKIINLIFSLIPLIVGGLLYLGYRSYDLLMFRWGESIGLSKIVSLWRNVCSQYTLPKWIINALPDGLWLLSYMLFIDFIWGNHNERKIWLYVLPTIAIVSELMQLWFPKLGTFDIMDLVCYLSAIFLLEIKTRIKWEREEI